MMNAGCYGKTISDNLIGCNVINRNGKVAYLKKKKLNFHTGKSQLIHTQTIVTSADFKEKMSIVKIKSQKK